MSDIVVGVSGVERDSKAVTRSWSSGLGGSEGLLMIAQYMGVWPSMERCWRREENETP